MKSKIKINDDPTYVKRPDRKIYQKAQAISNGAFRDALDNGAILRSELNGYMEKRGLWGKEKQEELNKINKKIDNSLLSIKRGGIKLEAARSIAVKTRELRIERTLLVAQRNQLDEFSAETQAENERFEFLVSECTVDGENEKIFKDLDDYKERSNDDLSFKAASALGVMLYGLEENWESELPENKFLIKYKFINDKLRLINKEGKMVSSDGKLINDSYQYINEEGKPVDEKGLELDEDGLPLVEAEPFLDESGNKIEDNKEDKEDKEKLPNE